MEQEIIGVIKKFRDENKISLKEIEIYDLAYKLESLFEEKIREDRKGVAYWLNGCANWDKIDDLVKLLNNGQVPTHG